MKSGRSGWGEIRRLAAQPVVELWADEHVRRLLSELDRVTAERDKLKAQAESDWRAACDALGWAHELHRKKLPEPSRSVRTLTDRMSQGDAAIDALKDDGA